MTVIHMAGGVALAASLLAPALWPAGTQAPDTATLQPAAYLASRVQPPNGYLLSKLRTHRVVIVGEAHRIKHDVDLVVDIIPRLATAGADTLAVEMFPAAEQGRIDRIVASAAWPEADAMAVMRAAAWPYREYLQILHAAWTFNRSLPPGRPALKILALGPGEDWREQLLPKGKTYDGFMAGRVLEVLGQSGRRVLVYCGIHHGFTRYSQPELPREKTVEKFMDRTGNVLWRELGEEVFLVTLHRPWQCRSGQSWSRCLPGDGAIDCAAAAAGRAGGFDIIGSPFAELRIAPNFLYAMGYPSPRLVDITDGWVWTKAIEAYQGVTLIPLVEFAPDAASLEYVSQRNPFSDKKGLGRAEIERLWSEERAALGDLQASFGWKVLAGWQQKCR